MEGETCCCCGGGNEAPIAGVGPAAAGVLPEQLRSRLQRPWRRGCGPAGGAIGAAQRVSVEVQVSGWVQTKPTCVSMWDECEGV